LVNQVGHERDNATAEVRRSFTTFYGPLYQAAYLLGGLQLRALHRELVETGKMADRDFHDAILRENGIPIDMVRALLTGRKLSPSYKPDWKFYGPIAVKHEPPSTKSSPVATTIGPGATGKGAGAGKTDAAASGVKPVSSPVARGAHRQAPKN
jgi:hypothetical protein